MGRISDEDKERVREATDIVALFSESIPLKQKGRTFWCCCPFHNEKTPSLCVDPDKQFWHCYGCGEGGDVFTFVQKYENIPFPEAVRKLADKAHIELKEDEASEPIPRTFKERLKQVCKATAEFYHAQLLRLKTPEAQRAREYLSKRNLGNEVAKKWQLGYAPGRSALVNHLRSLGFTPEEMIGANVAIESGNGARDRFYERVMFPIRDEFGDVIAFGGRVIGDGNPKYLNSQETPIFQKSHTLFALDKAKVSIATEGFAIVTEGYTDVIALHEAGITNTIATLGTALTKQHIRMLDKNMRMASRDTRIKSQESQTGATNQQTTLKTHGKPYVIYLFDGDSAGQRAADRAISVLGTYLNSIDDGKSVDIFAITLPNNLDPAECIEAYGVDRLRGYLKDPVPIIRYGIDRRLAKYDLSKPEGRTSAFSDALSVLAPIKDTMLARSHALRIASLTRFTEDEALRALRRLTYKESKDPETHQNPPCATPPEVSSLPSTSTQRKNLGELNRLRFERQFLAVIAANPHLGLVHADVLAQTHWHNDTFRCLADAMLEQFITNPSISAATLISTLSYSFPGVTGMLTEYADSEIDPNAVEAQLLFLIEELSIGDLEDDLELMRVSQYKAELTTDEERQMIFSVITEMQKEIARKKRAHQQNPVLQGE